MVGGVSMREDKTSKQTNKKEKENSAAGGFGSGGVKGGVDHAMVDCLELISVREDLHNRKRSYSSPVWAQVIGGSQRRAAIPLCQNLLQWCSQYLVPPLVVLLSCSLCCLLSVCVVVSVMTRSLVFQNGFCVLLGSDCRSCDSHERWMCLWELWGPCDLVKGI